MALRHPSIEQRNIFVTALLVILFLSTQYAVAQVTTARLEGVVKDPTDAVIPGVVVVATNTGTNLSTEAVTNDTGLYVFPRLLPGTYTVSAELKGFKKSINQGVILQVGDTATLNIKLETGELTETVTVAAEAEVVDHVSTSLGKVINTRQIENLPLVDRNAMQLFYLQPGANRFTGGGVADGTRAIGANVTVEGVSAQDPDLGSGATTIAAPVPIEAVGEYRVVTSSASAEYGRGSGAQVQLVYRSGTNQFHGSAFDFHRNRALNANSFANNAATPYVPRPAFIRNQFGGSLGGRIIKDKAFFHVTYEGIRQKQDYSTLATVYTNTLKSGIFRYWTKGRNSNTLVDPATGVPTVPASEIATINLLTADPTRLGKDASGLFDKMVGNFPAPNDYTTGDGFNTAGYYYTYSRPLTQDQFVIKGDYVLNSKHRLSATFANQYYTRIGSGYLNGYRSYDNEATRPTAIIALDSTLSPNWLNEFRVGGVKYKTKSINPDPDRFNPKGIVIFMGLGGPGRGNPKDISLVDIYSPAVITIADNTTWIKGNHSIRGGFSVAINRDQIKYGNDYWIPVIDTSYSANQPNLPTYANLNSNDRNNAMQYLNDLTGSLGRIEQIYSANSTTAYSPFEVPYRQFRAREWSTFAQDTWKVKPNLTLNLGMQWEVMPPQYEDAGLYPQPVGGTPGLLGVSGSLGATQIGIAPDGGRHVYNTGWRNFAPNVGFNWDPFNDGKWSISANYRLAYDRHYLTNTLFMTISQEGMQSDRVLSGSAGMRLTDLNKLFNSVTGYFDPGTPLGPKAFNRSGLVTAWDPSYYLPYTSSWSLRIQHELTKGTVVAVSYVGNKATGLMRSVNFNQLEIRKNGYLTGFLAAARNLTANGDPAKGEATGVFGQLYSGMSSSDKSSMNTYLRNGDVASSANFIDRTKIIATTPVDYLAKAGLPNTFFRLNPQFDGVWLQGNNSNSTYEGLKVELNRRFHAGLQFDANYTLAKALTDYEGGQSQRDAYRDNANRKLDKTYAGIDARHVLNANFIWEVPVGTGRRWMNGSNLILNGLLGGWQINGLFGYASGSPFTVSSGYNKLSTGDASTAECTNCDPYISSKVIKGSNLFALTAGEIAQFYQPAAGSAGGTAQRFFRSPSLWTADGSVFKAFSIKYLGEQGSLQTRFEFNNAFNHPQFGSMTSTLTSATFGQISKPTGNYRIIVVALKLIF